MSANDFFTSLFPFYKKKLNSMRKTNGKYKKRRREKNHFLGHVVSEACPIKKEKKNKFSIRNSCTAEDNCGRKSHIYSNSLLFLPPLYRPQRTNKHTNKQSFCARLSFFFHPFLHTMIDPHVLFANISSFSLCSPRGWTAETVVFGWAAMFMCVFCPLLLSTKRCHGDALSTLPVKAALTAAVLRTRRDCCSFLPPWNNTTH